MSKNTLNSESQIYSIPSTPLNEKRNKNDLHFTRSQCLGGSFCSAECLYHQKKRKLKSNLNLNNESVLKANLNSNSDFQSTLNKVQMNKNKISKIGYGHLSDDEGICDEEIEEVSIFRTIKNFIVLNNTDNTHLFNNKVSLNKNLPNVSRNISFKKIYIFIPLIALIFIFLWYFCFLNQNAALLFGRNLSSPLNSKSKYETKYLLSKNNGAIYREVYNLKLLVTSLTQELNNLKKHKESILNCNKCCKDMIKTNENLLMSYNDLKDQKSQREKNNFVEQNFSLQDVNNLIKKELAKYDADKTGLPDFALEFSGGEIVNIRCSETYDLYGINYRLFGMSVWKTSNSPRSVIQPNMQPGECWAFKGFQGYLVIKLSQEIIPEQFSYEHISVQISRDGNIDSAPKDFEVRGLKDEKETDGWLLGKYRYDDKGEPLQFFKVQDPNPRPTRYIELTVNSNYGHLNYTCLYRFRVHGKRITF